MKDKPKSKIAELAWLGAWLLAVGVPAVRGDGSAEQLRYLRLTPKETVIECTFTIHRSARGWSIRSVTESGKNRLALTAKYAQGDRLTATTLSLFTPDEKKTCKVDVAGGKADVHRSGKITSFAIPAGVIVTSAPDWTDTFLLCRKYDRTRGGRQSFAGLWIHPQKEPLRLTFTAERTGTDIIEHDGKKQQLVRLEIRLRNNDGYVAWVDDRRRMIKLQPLQSRTGYALVLDGYQKSAARLRAPGSGNR